MREGVAVGLVVDEVDFPVEEGKVREFALAAGDDDLTAVPLTFAAIAGHWRDQAAMVERLGLDIRKVVVGGSEWEHHAPVAIGDRLAGPRVLAAIERKPRGDGEMVLLTLETRLARGDGELAVVQRDTVIELP
jgi:acyl dehydratase